MVLYKNDKPLLNGYWEDLEWFVEELKRLNPKFVDRREFKIINKISKDGSFDEIFKTWNRK